MFCFIYHIALLYMDGMDRVVGPISPIKSGKRTTMIIFSAHMMNSHSLIIFLYDFIMPERH